MDGMCGHGRHLHHHQAQTGRTERPKADDKRASDAEREQVATELRHHAGEGRLSVDELEDRLGAALTATTRRDLAALTDDLPRAQLARRRDERRELAEHVRSYLAVMALLVAIWALTGADYFWPVWPALGWGIGVLSHAGAVRRTPARRLVA
jgi:hypothetical protein